MYICIHVYVYICIYIYIYIHLYTNIYMTCQHVTCLPWYRGLWYICIYIYIYIYIHICICIFIYIFYIYRYVCIFIYIYTYIDIYVYVYTCICIYLCMYIYIYIYIYIHIYMTCQHVACFAWSRVWWYIYTHICTHIYDMSTYDTSHVISCSECLCVPNTISLNRFHKESKSLQNKHCASVLEKIIWNSYDMQPSNSVLYFFVECVSECLKILKTSTENLIQGGEDA